MSVLLREDVAYDGFASKNDFGFRRYRKISLVFLFLFFCQFTLLCFTQLITFHTASYLSYLK